MLTPWLSDALGALLPFSLRENSLGETGGIAVAEALKINTSLQSLT